MTEEQPLSYNDHFFGFSKWTKNCLPYDVRDFKYIWLWMDGDCIFQNDKTNEVHLIEIKVEHAHVKSFQQRILTALEEKGIKTHTLRLFYEPYYFGDHEILGDPRYAKKIVLDNKEVGYTELLQTLLEWHGIDPNINVSNYLHPKADAEMPKTKIENFM